MILSLLLSGSGGKMKKTALPEWYPDVYPMIVSPSLK